MSERRWFIVAVVLFLIFTTGIAFAYTPDANAPRSAVPDIYKWDLTLVFKSDAAFESALKKVDRRLGEFQKFKGKLKTAGEVAACLDEYFAIYEIVSPLSAYSYFKIQEDAEVLRYEKMRGRAESLMKDVAGKTAFIRQEILGLGNDDAQKILSDPKIAPYKDYIKDILRRKDHVLGIEAEGVLSGAGDFLFTDLSSDDLPSAFNSTFDQAMRDIKFPKIKDENGKEVELTLANYGKYRASKDRRVRSETVGAFFATLKKYNNILASNLAGEFKRDVFFARARKYNRAVDAYLDRENVNSAVVENLIRTVDANVGVLHRYVALRKKLLGLPDVHLYDLYTPIVPAVSAEVTYDEAVKDVDAALQVMGSDYMGVLSKAIQPGSGWTDIYPNRGKVDSAFSYGMWGYHPYVKLNYMNELDDASTLAHEFGHAMHAYLNNKAQSFPNSGYATMLAEIASTFNEVMFSEYLLNKFKDNDDMRLYLLGERVESIRTTIFRQTLFTEFELKLHELAEAGVPITADVVNKTYIDLVKKYYGPGFTIDKNDDIEWAYVPHFYKKFYVFSYATGLSSGIALAEKIGAGDVKARDGYIEMLKTSYTVPPAEALKKAGVDITKPDAIVAAIKLMDKTITEMEKIAAKKK